MEDLLLVIPAIKKNAVIPDQLIKKLNGTTLIQRAINTALEMTTKNNIYVITDSEEISLICERNCIKYYKDSTLSLSSENILYKISSILSDAKRHILVYQANAPLIAGKDLKNAYQEFLKDPFTILVSTKKHDKKILTLHESRLQELEYYNSFEELKAFYIFSNTSSTSNMKPYIIEKEKSIEIESYQDWWVCEKILQRKKIIFHVFGSIEIGMGHIYHSLSLAHEITDHEIVFVCDQKYKIAVDKIASMDYRVIATDNVLNTILELKPDLVINDVLNTETEFIKKLKSSYITTVNFEDIGEGSQHADLVFNELYDEPLLSGNQYLWGHTYLALRDEFYEAKPHQFTDTIQSVLITFGGTDQNNLTLMSLQAIINIAKVRSLHIYIVCGNAYGFKTELEMYIQQLAYPNLTLTYACGIISKIMEQTPIAISSNGRTVYELADMNIPSIILSHHERESTHTFASLEKGFINLGIYSPETSSKQITTNFLKLVEDSDYRKLLYLNIQQYSFRDNKKKVVSKIMKLL